MWQPYSSQEADPLPSTRLGALPTHSQGRQVAKVKRDSVIFGQNGQLHRIFFPTEVHGIYNGRRLLNFLFI